MKTLFYSLPNEQKKIPLFIGFGLLRDHKFIKELLQPLSSEFAIITDSNVGPLFGETLAALLRQLGFKVEVLSFPAGEFSKNRETKERIENTLFEKGFGKRSGLISIGGGVVTDLAGYIAATFCRGIALINIPTSLLGMVDASMGGKNGVNTPYGKNLIGTIYQPNAVILDTETLKTLPQKEFKEGLAECIKHAALLDEALFGLLEKESVALLNRQEPLLETVILANCQIKGKIIAEDEKEKGKRRLLNFGHTVGHALETLSHYHLSHGDAVALGMLIESRLFLERQEMDLDSFNRILKILKTYEFLAERPSHSMEDILKIMSLDKKASNGSPRFVGIQSIGTPLSFNGDYCTEVEKEQLEKALSYDMHRLS